MSKAEHIDGGCILIARQILHGTMWTMPPNTRIVAMTCLLMANHKTRKVWIGGKEMTINRGQFWTSIDNLQYICNGGLFRRERGQHLRNYLSAKSVRTALSQLERVQFLASQSTNRGRLLSVCNYNTYQNINLYRGKPKGKQAAGKGQAEGKQGATNNNGNNGDKGEECKTTPIARSDSGESSSHNIPDDLKGLELYEADKKLCAAWPTFKKAQELACPGINVVAVTRRLHAWEVSNPKKRKKNRTRFLSNNFAREQDRPSRTQGEGYDNTKQRRGEVGRVPTPPGARFRESEKIA